MQEIKYAKNLKSLSQKDIHVIFKLKVLILIQENSLQIETFLHVQTHT